MKRVLVIGGAVVVAAVAVAIYTTLSSLDSLVKTAIERYGSEIAGVPVRVGSVSITLTDGRGTIRGLRVGNPQGYASGDAFRLGEITLDIDPRSVAATPIVIDELNVEAPEANFEVDAAGRSNFDVIRKNIDAHSGSSSGGAGEEGGGDETRIAIHRFTFENGSATADVSAVDPGQPKPLHVDLPAVKLNNLGGEGGATGAQIAKTILSAFTKAVARSVAASQAARAVEKQIGGSTGEAAGGLIRKLMD